MHTIGRFKLYSLIALAVLLEVTALNRAELFGAKPDIVLVLVVFAGLFMGPARGLETGLAAGFLNDVFTLDYFGMNALVLGLTGLAAGAASGNVSRESRAADMVIVMFFTAFSMLVHLAAVSFLAGPSLRTALGEYIAASVIPASAYTALVSVPIFDRLTNMFGLREPEGLL